MARQIEDGEGNSYVSGTAVKISSSSRCNSSSDLTLANSSSVWAGSQDATRRWLRARATFARLRMTSDSVFESDMLGGVGVFYILCCREEKVMRITFCDKRYLKAVRGMSSDAKGMI